MAPVSDENKLTKCLLSPKVVRPYLLSSKVLSTLIPGEQYRNGRLTEAGELDHIVRHVDETGSPTYAWVDQKFRDSEDEAGKKRMRDEFADAVMAAMSSVQSMYPEFPMEAAPFVEFLFVNAWRTLAPGDYKSDLQKMQYVSSLISIALKNWLASDEEYLKSIEERQWTPIARNIRDWGLLRLTEIAEMACPRVLELLPKLDDLDYILDPIVVLLENIRNFQLKGNVDYIRNIYTDYVNHFPRVYQRQVVLALAILDNNYDLLCDLRGEAKRKALIDLGKNIGEFPMELIAKMDIIYSKASLKTPKKKPLKIGGGRREQWEFMKKLGIDVRIDNPEVTAYERYDKLLTRAGGIYSTEVTVTAFDPKYVAKIMQYAEVRLKLLHPKWKCFHPVLLVNTYCLFWTEIHASELKAGRSMANVPSLWNRPYAIAALVERALNEFYRNDKLYRKIAGSGDKELTTFLTLGGRIAPKLKHVLQAREFRGGHAKSAKERLENLFMSLECNGPAQLLMTRFIWEHAPKALDHSFLLAFTMFKPQEILGPKSPSVLFEAMDAMSSDLDYVNQTVQYLNSGSNEDFRPNVYWRRVFGGMKRPIVELPELRQGPDYWALRARDDMPARTPRPTPSPPPQLDFVNLPPHVGPAPDWPDRIEDA